ncbi:MAG: endo-1,4-beta-xylanase [Lachnospiraceae bacterium]|nr:endo-1,4-beta-xylanase [Lachnospiraceae bacterium]
MKKISCLIISVMILVMSGCAALPQSARTGPVQNGQNEQTVQDQVPSAENGEQLSEETLRALFEKHGMKAGTCVSSMVIENPAMEKLILEQFDSVTMENAMKPDAVINREKSRKEGKIVVEYGNDAKKVLNWAKENGMKMRGHTLVWYSQTPEWIFHEDFDETKGFVDREEMLVRMEDLIRGNFEQIDELGCSDLFYAYDVVNEGWMENGIMRRNHWSEIIGDDYMWYAFYYADKYAPEETDLYYNDYNEQFKADAICKFVQTLTDEDGRYLIDGIGLQAHFFTADDLNGYLKAVDRLSETGLKLELTELDVGLGKYQAPLKATDENLNKQGQFYYELINGLFERADAGKIDMDAITFWGFTDLISWRKEYSPQLFDSLFAEKPAYYGVMQIKEKAGFEEEQ